ncbi:superoxide dismutase family protein [Streptomyces sp. NPDC029674]|uniref:superoxide dismutase family protein n=1 Tax=Streptomyces sp. NPDC029674 TaxID=3365297 RepID=UPI00384ECA26
MAAAVAVAAVEAAALVTGSGPAGAVAGTSLVRVEGRFAPPSAFIPSPAVTYDQKLVPAASWIEVVQHGVGHGAGGGSGTAVGLRVRGMKPGHSYGVHVHQKPCGVEPEASGGHYQHRVDPVQPSKDPAYLNPANEVWLDFTAGADGSGSASAEHGWGFRPGEAASVVLHDEPGGAGDRSACFTVPFVPQSHARPGRSA